MLWKLLQASPGAFLPTSRGVQLTPLSTGSDGMVSLLKLSIPWKSPRPGPHPWGPAPPCETLRKPALWNVPEGSPPRKPAPACAEGFMAHPSLFRWVLQNINLTGCFYEKKLARYTVYPNIPLLRYFIESKTCIFFFHILTCLELECGL